MIESNWQAPPPPSLVDGPLTGADRPMLEGFLAWERSTLRNISAGLTGEQLARRSVPPSSLSLLGLVRHLTKVERVWFRQRAAGQPVPPLHAEAKDADFERVDALHAAADFAAFDEECRLADEAVAAMSLDDTFEVHGQAHSLRLVYLHMIAEYARHNGHADLLRELIDGRTGA